MIWKETLIGIFRDSREFPGWETIKSLHDDEDRTYFEMLEELYKNGLLETTKDEKAFAQRELLTEEKWKIKTLA